MAEERAAQALREQRARARGEGFRSNNNKYGVEANRYLADAIKFSEENNPPHQELQKIYDEASALDAKAAELEAKIKTMEAASTPQANVALDSPELKARCQALEGKRLISLGGPGPTPGGSDGDIQNSGFFKIDLSRDVKRDPVPARRDLGSASLAVGK